MARQTKTAFALVCIVGSLLCSASGAVADSLSACQSPGHETTLRREGALFSVMAQINGKSARLIVDSGAETLLLTTAAAHRLGLPLDGPTAPLVSVRGESSHRLVALETVTVAFINAQKLVGGITTQSFDPGVDGLLGRSFLDDFIYALNPGEMRLTLFKLGCGEEKVGGETEKWWRRRYTSLRDPLRLYRRLLNDKLTNSSSGYQSLDRITASLSQKQLQGLVDFYDLHLWRLDQRANAQKVPSEWRAQ